MARITFFEKPGCGGNAKQKALLSRSGHELDVRSLLSHPWTVDTLRPFFGGRPVSEWFNPSAPKVKSGEIDPQAYSEAEALALLVAEPLLIRRPLMQVGEQRTSGFRQDEVHAWIGLKLPETEVTDACPRDHASAG